jgi:hypothetical protein
MTHRYSLIISISPNFSIACTWHWEFGFSLLQGFYIALHQLLWLPFAVGLVTVDIKTVESENKTANVRLFGLAHCTLELSRVIIWVNAGYVSTSTGD